MEHIRSEQKGNWKLEIYFKCKILDLEFFSLKTFKTNVCLLLVSNVVEKDMLGFGAEPIVSRMQRNSER